MPEVDEDAPEILVVLLDAVVHGADVLLVEEAGGKVTDVHGLELDFSQGDQLTKNQGVIVTNGILRDAVLAAYKNVSG